MNLSVLGIFQFLKNDSFKYVRWRNRHYQQECWSSGKACCLASEAHAIVDAYTVRPKTTGFHLYCVMAASSVWLCEVQILIRTTYAETRCMSRFLHKSI